MIVVAVLGALTSCGVAHGPATGPRSKASPGRFAAGTGLQPVSEVAVLSNDRTLVAEATWGCTGPPQLVAAPHAQTIALVLAESPVPRGTICAADLVIGSVHTTLPSRLGGRELVQRENGTPIPAVYQASLPPVRTLPPGYRFAALAPGSVPVAFGKGDQRASTRTFTAARTDAPVQVCEAAGSVPAAGPSGWPVVATLDIHGARAIYRAETSGGIVDARQIAWAAGGRVFAVASWQDNAGQRVPSEAQLLAVARGIRRE